MLLSKNPGARRCLLPACSRPAPPRSPLVCVVLGPSTGIHLGTRRHPRPLPDLGRATSGAGINSMGKRSAKASGARAAGGCGGGGVAGAGVVGGGRTREGRARGGGARPGGAARAKVPSWEMQL